MNSVYDHPYVHDFSTSLCAHCGSVGLEHHKPFPESWEEIGKTVAYSLRKLATAWNEWLKHRGFCDDCLWRRGCAQEKFLFDEARRHNASALTEGKSE